MNGTRLAWGLSCALVLVVATAYVYQLPRVGTTTTSPVDSSEMHVNRGLGLHRQGDLDAAMAEYQRAVALNPRSALAFYDIGVVHYQQRRIDEAIAAYRRAAALDPKMADAHYNLAYALSHDKHEFQDAIAHLSRTIEISPNMAKAHFEMGVAYSALKMSDRAQSSFNTALKLDPSLAGAIQ